VRHGGLRSLVGVGTWSKVVSEQVEVRCTLYFAELR
jgi:hypothetical protein